METFPCPSLPAPFLRLGRLVPLPLLRASVEPILNRVFKEALLGGTLEALESRELVLEISDIGLEIAFRVRQQKLKILAPGTRDACIRGPLAAFAWLAAREADADTLFFHRHLSMEGDTELGLIVKNTVDAIDLSAIPALLRQALKGFNRLIPAQAPGVDKVMPGSPYQ